MSTCDVLARVVRAREALEDDDLLLAHQLLADLETDLAAGNEAREAA